jgi:hypothetical protein
MCFVNMALGGVIIVIASPLAHFPAAFLYH